MNVDVSFSNAKVYNIERFDVVIGQKFSLFTDSAEPIKWFSDNDPVLAISANGMNADIEATGLGESIIFIMDAAFTVIKKLTIKVVSAILEPAATLGLSSDPPVDKP